MKKLLVLAIALFSVFALVSCGHKHTMEHHAAKAAECEKAGNIEYWSCAECGKFFADEAGTTELEEAKLAVAAKGHTPKDLEAVEPTCTEKGKTAGKECSVCGKILEAQQDVEALGHKIEKVEATDSNEMVQGVIEHYRCERCDARFADADGKQPLEEEAVYKPYLDKLAVTEGALVDPEEKLFFAVGGFEGTWGPNEGTQMLGATTIAAVKAIDEKLGKELEKRAADIKSLYYAVVVLGAEDAKWTTNALYKDVLVQMNGSFTVKAIKGHYDEDTENYITDQWIPDPKTGHVESLTPDTLFIAANWAEDKDKLGFDWTANPAGIAGPGAYYLICADYGKVSTTEVYGYGLALVKAVELNPQEGVQDRVPAQDKLAVEKDALEDKDHMYFAVGGFEGTWGPNEGTQMDGATTVAAVKALDAELGAALEAKGDAVKAIYYSMIQVGTTDGGWSTNAKVGDKLYSYNGSFTVKAIKGHYDEDTENYITDQWIPDPKTAHVECLTPKTLFIASNWAEEKDDDGFDWTANPVAVGGAGWYYLIVVDYGQVSSTEVYGYGLALVKILDGEAAVNPFELKDLVLADHTFGVIGSFEGSGWNTDTPMTKVEGQNKYQATVTLVAGNQLKVRADGQWADSWGTTGYNGGNFEITEDGTYLVTIAFESDKVAYTSEGFPGTVTVEKQ